MAAKTEKFIRQFIRQRVGALTLIALLGLAMLGSGPVFAQSVDNQSASQSPDQSQIQGQDGEATAETPGVQGPITRDQLLALIANEVVLAPGVGLQNIRLGESLDSVQARLGPPTSVSRSGILPRLTNLSYLLDGGTVVILTGREVIERIMVRGNAAALIRTVQGARFGMDPTLIQRIYRGPTRIRDNRIEYANRGVTFYFGERGGGQGLSDGVSRIDIYPRQG